MHYEIKYDNRVRSDVRKIGKSWLLRIMDSINTKLTTEPEKFGKPLRKSLKNYRRLRVGAHRVIFKIEDKTVKIIAIGHRSGVYKNFDF